MKCPPFGGRGRISHKVCVRWTDGRTDGHGKKKAGELPGQGTDQGYSKVPLLLFNAHKSSLVWDRDFIFFKVII